MTIEEILEKIENEIDMNGGVGVGLIKCLLEDLEWSGVEDYGNINKWGGWIILDGKTYDFAINDDKVTLC
jgi:hypothetical protein